MASFYIRKGRDIKIKGAAEKQIVSLSLPSKVCVQPFDFKGIRPRLLVKVDDLVKVGTPLLEDKIHQDIKVASPASGKIIAINRGEKRVLNEVVIQTDSQQQFQPFKQFSSSEITNLFRDNAIRQLLDSGLWVCVRQRPFSKIANPADKPKSIFIQAMNTEPMALDVDFALNNCEKEFQAGIEVLRRLTDGPVHLCCSKNARSKALTQAKNVQVHTFSGPHPSGNVSTHIHHVDPIGKGQVVWYVRAEDVLRIGRLFLTGTVSPEKFVAVTGEGASKRVYVKTIIGAPVKHLIQGSADPQMRYLSGSILAGKDVGPEGYLCFYDSQVTVIPRGGKREFLGWLMPGFNKYSFSRTFASSFGPEKEASLNTDRNGSDRAIVLNHVYDQYVPLDIMTFFLIKAVLIGDIEEMEKLGILECDEEDFALCSFACPSKFDVGGVIREGLDLIEKEG